MLKGSLLVLPTETKGSPLWTVKLRVSRRERTQVPKGSVLKVIILLQTSARRWKGMRSRTR